MTSARRDARAARRGVWSIAWLAGIGRRSQCESIRQLPRLFDPFIDGHINHAERAIKAREAVARESWNHMKVKVEDVLTTVLAVVLANRNAIGRAHGLHCGRHARKCRHQRACKSTINLIDLCDVPDGHDKHMAAVAGLLTAARKHCGVAIAKRHNTRRQFTPQDATEHARRCCFHGHRFFRVPIVSVSNQLESVRLTLALSRVAWRHDITGTRRRLQRVLGSRISSLTFCQRD